MLAARDIMTSGTEFVGTEDSVLDAARKMTELGVGALPICGTDNTLQGVLTDRDIVIKVLGQGRDPQQTCASDLAQGEAVTIGADDSADEILATMARYKVRRLPVVDGNRLVGMVALADVARALPVPQVGGLLAALSAD
ncbi:CBS domain-containing protein [Streptomyces sp. Je 1-4]|uniref:CBS domain-containing protein n=1 Tax=Streptomyces TaxID=1883 RepID=UPI00140ECAC8|nr:MULTISPECIES: CBS domain-containing protein [unclassified Streptomyces]QIK10855.1 CBS domain-containing protein [Streptomyces sp. ID38640]UYB37787.1 CBS domain-containing protein [Streptomyces sp. Je 1-4]UZQ33700.1 CBS domain-containing protein [Streptomyces sp. Je 1-4] [Streptomyces sp. Je 1-4 4N24]UZQ41118.1 CBS domain-containing protein [Streptomyces sp. Je 1-4] [Streptomyces sp. Je 1-4 4N24_ara]